MSAARAGESPSSCAIFGEPVLISFDWVAGTRRTSFLALAVALGALQACSEGPTASRSTAPVYAADLKGQSKTCEASRPSLTAGQTVDATMKLSNDGWCGVTVSQSGKPFASGLLTTRPLHGKVLIHQVGDDTRIDFTPTPGFIGVDNFTVKLLPTEPSVRIAVTVSGAAAR